MDKRSTSQFDPTPQISVGESPDPSLLFEKLDAIRQKEILKRERQVKAAGEIAHYRWQIAQHVHLLEDGVSHLNFESHPYQKGIYQDPALDLVIFGSAQWGKTEFLIVDMAASAGYGLKVLMVLSKGDKRDKFASSRLDPCFRTVPMYKEMLEAAASRAADTDSTRFKHFGPGSINLVAASSKKDFTSHPADKTMIDEHQECDQSNLVSVDDRMSASWFQGMVRVGHPTTGGTEQNANLDWLYQNSDRRIWKIACDTCGKVQMLTWWNHIVVETRSRSGIVAVRPRDAEWVPGGRLDIRPICEECARPIDRLKDGEWVQLNPGHERHGYKLSNLYNATRRLDKLFERYSAARFSSHLMSEFVNKQLGEPWDSDGAKITDAILAACSAGEKTGILPYRFVHASQFRWRKELVA